MQAKSPASHITLKTSACNPSFPVFLFMANSCTGFVIGGKRNHSLWTESESLPLS
jgi:hypothetical protein